MRQITAMGWFSRVLPLLTTIFASTSFAQLQVSYMVIPPTVPTTITTLTPATTPFSFKAMLPGYGMVQVTLTPCTTCTPAATLANAIIYENLLFPFTFIPSHDPLGYTWGASVSAFSLYAGNGNTSYTLTFTFLEWAPPDPSQLLLVVASLAAAQRPPPASPPGLPNGTTVEVSQPGNLVGEYAFPPFGASPDPTATSCLGLIPSHNICPTAGTWFYSGYEIPKYGQGDIQNTGWALFQATGPITIMSAMPTLTLNVSQQGGDGINFTLGYTPTGYIEVCKASETTNPVPANGIYSYTVQGVTGSSLGSSTNPIMVPVGECSGPIPVSVPASGTVAITELPTPGVAVDLNAITAVGYSAPPFSTESSLLESTTPPGTANVIVVPPATAGDTSTETMVTFYNYEAPPGKLKLCKIQGQGVTPNMLFNFVVSSPHSPSINETVGAGPANEGGYCVVVAGTVQVGSSVTVTEMVATGYPAPAITVNGVATPSVGCTPTPYCVIAVIGPGTNEVSFTNDPPPGRDVSSNLGIVSYSLVGQVASTGTLSYLTYRADLLNTGTTILSPLIARLSSLDPSSVQVVGQGELNFASAPANSQIASSNTFTILTDPAVPLDFSKLSWAFHSRRSVPPTRR